MKILNKNILREFKFSIARFISIATLLALGVFILIGLKVTGNDMRQTANSYYTSHKMADAVIKSISDISKSDQTKIKKINHIKTIEFSNSTDGLISNSNQSIRIQANTTKLSISKPTTGRLPQNNNEIALSSRAKGKYKLGDYITINNKSHEKLSTLKNSKLKVVGFVTSADYLLKQNLGATTVGTGQIDNWTLLRCNMLEIPVLQSYGMTETTSNISALNFDDAEIKAGSCGQPFFTTQIRITNINQDNIGNIELKSPTVAVGYLNKQKLYQSRFTKDGFFKTGDVGYLDDDNFLYIKGRQADLIYSDDKIIYPEEVENIFRSVNGIIDICIVGILGKDGKEVPVAYLTMQENAFLTSADLQEFGQHNLVDYQVPSEYRQIDKFPKSTNGKILRNRLLNLKYKTI